MSKKLLKSIVLKLKEKKLLNVSDVVAIAQISTEKQPLTSKIQTYLTKYKELSHAQYYELISMANGYSNFDSFKPTLSLIQVPEKVINTGSILLDHFIKQFPKGFQLTNAIAFNDLQIAEKHKMNQLELKNILCNLNLKENSNGTPIGISLFENSLNINLLQIRIIPKFANSFSNLSSVDIPLRTKQMKQQSLIAQEDEIYTISCELKIIKKTGGVNIYNDLKIIGKENFLDLLRNNRDLFNELRKECIIRLEKNFPYHSK